MAGNTLVAKIFYYLFVIYDRKEEPSINDVEEAAVENETAKLRRSTRWRVYGFWGSILNLFPSLGIHFIKVRMVWTNFLGIHSVSKGRHRVDRLF